MCELHFRLCVILIHKNLFFLVENFGGESVNIIVLHWNACCDLCNIGYYICLNFDLPATINLKS
jgi:hypothetical protein